MTLKVLTGNYTVALAAKMARVQVIGAYPITPQTSIIEKLSEYVEKGELEAEVIRVESEHSALAAAFGAAIAGARAFTATSSQGLLYMQEMVHWTSRARIPLVMAIVSRAIAPPWNIWPDHTDFMNQRDTGWILGFGMDNQEIFDLIIQAFKISEDPRVYLPVMIGLEGFILGHTTMPVEVPEQKDIDEWLGPRTQPYVTDGTEAFSLGQATWPEDSEEMYMDIQRAMEKARSVIKEVDESYGRRFGRSYGGLISKYRCSDAKYHVISMGAWSGDIMDAVDELRSQGYPVGLIRIRFVRPFPGDEIYETIASSKGVIVFDRAISFGSAGPIYLDVASTVVMRSRKTPYIKNVIAGMGGVNVTYREFADVIKKTIDELEGGSEPPVLEWYHRR